MGELKKSYSDKNILKQVPMFYFKSGNYKSTKVKLDVSNSIACDGKYVYMHIKE
jgi:hypothetical protein